MTYTEEQKAAFRIEFAARRKKQRLVSIPLAVLMIGVLLVLDEKAKGPVFGVSPAIVVAALTAVLIAGVVFSLRNWRCPACRRYLGKHMNPSFCHRCGIPLR